MQNSGEFQDKGRQILKTRTSCLTIIVLLVGVGNFFEDGQDLLVGRSVLDGVPDGDGRGVTR